MLRNRNPFRRSPLASAVTALAKGERRNNIGLTMRVFASLILCLISASFAGAQDKLKQARLEWLEGNYAEARALYEGLAKDAANRLPATLGLSRALESQGEYDKAQSAVTNLLKDQPTNPALLARLGELHYLRGRFEEAEKNAEAAIKENADQFLAHWVLAQVHRDRGDLDKADTEFLWFVRASNRLNITDPDDLRLTGLAGLERARYRHLSAEFQTVIDNYFRAASSADKMYWPGEYEAGRLFMEKHNKPAAFKAFEKAMTINPRAAEVLVCKGQMAAAGMEFKDVERYAEQALKVNPRYLPALCLKADLHWFSGEIDTVLKTLEKARDVNPRDEAALARLAACYFMLEKKDDFQSLVKTAQKNNPKCYTFLTDLAHLLEQRKLHEQAEKYYMQAIEMQPKLPEAQTGLGMLYMRMAKEEEAKATLEKAFDADKFNVRVFNSLKVLDHLETYESLKTEHFIIRYDKKNDTVLANFMAVYLENTYKELADQFDYRPKGPFQIQVFMKHEMFSGRVVAVPDLHTIGACTGPLVAMVSPRDTSKVITKPFNWNRVIRHELVHVFNLEQTKGKVPHWFTEGLAVRYEGPNIPPTWHALLADKVANNDLLNLDNILLGFIRPRSPLQWQQAYLQSLLYVEYLTKTHGEKSIGKMLAAFQDGLDTGPALEKAVGVKKDAFEKGYRAFLAERVKNNPAGALPKEMTLKQLREAHAKNPADPEIGAMLAEKNYFIGKKKDAKEIVNKILDDMPRHPGAAYVKALLYLDDKNPSRAISLLESLEDLKDTKPLKLLIKLQVDTMKHEQAITTCEKARKIDPHDPTLVGTLAKLYSKTGQKDKLIEIAEEVTRMDTDDLGSRRTLAKHYFDLGKHEEAARFARMGLEIDVLDGECQRVILASLTALNRNEEADRLRKVFDR
ncbi:MAG: tetratricopeptide repeat protein [Planctomycetes bacterium]|nr:tetratricopeptide repeat protein [Planctomycetota bacterium]